MRTMLVVGILALVTLAGCVDGKDGKTAETPEVEVNELPPKLRPVTSNDLGSYIHNISMPIDGVSVATATMIHMRTPVDEFIELDTWIAVPNVEFPVATVLEVTPYYAGGNPAPDTILEPSPETMPFNRMATELVQRGYAVGISSVRGTGNSGGCFTQAGPDEAKDTAKVLEHIAEQDWSNGNVGIMGVSYPGTTPQDVWVEAPEPLKAIVPISGISDMYKYNFVNGVHINIQGFGFNTYYWALVGALPFPLGIGGLGPVTDPPGMITAVPGEACPEQADVQGGGITSTVDGNKDAYWQIRDFHAEAVADPHRDRPAVFYIHGLQDWNVKPHMMEDWLPMLQESGSEYKVWLGQWGHAWPQGGECAAPEDGQVRACRNDWWELAVVAWFDQFLYGKETGILDAPRVQVQDDEGLWHHEQVWPPLDATPVVYGLTADGKLTAEPGSGSVTYNDMNGGLAVAIPGQNTVTSIEWRSDVLTENMTFSGQPVFHANVTATGARASLVLSLFEERADGTRKTFNHCAQSLNHVASLANGATDISGLRQEVEVACFPQDDKVHAGSRIVVIASGNTIGSPAPGLQPVSTGSDITIELDGAWMMFPWDQTIVPEDPQPYAA